MIFIYALAFAGGFLLLTIVALAMVAGDYEHVVIAALVGSLLVLVALRGVVADATRRGRR